jgi:hypothetical protein
MLIPATTNGGTSEAARLFQWAKHLAGLGSENDATLGNSGVCRISDDESWVTVAEGRVSFGARKGENNRVILARIATG